MLVIGLTGGIASGKSLVAAKFQQRGIDIIDTDQLARELVVPGSPTLAAIVERFGESIVNIQGELNRQRLRQRIFNHTEDKQWLEQLLHPAILARCNERLPQCRSPYVIIVVPLLVETWKSYPYSMIDRICVVDCPESLQIARLMQRDNITQIDAENSLKQQATRQQRLDLANDVIHNDADETSLDLQVTHLHEYYLTLSQ